MLRRLALLGILAALLAPAGAPGAPGAAAAAPPEPEAAAYIVVDPATGEALAQRAPDRELPMASTTKIMTALVVLDRAELDDVLTVPEAAAATGGSTGELVAGERLSVRDLLIALIVPSGNDAAVALALGVAGSEAAFVELMNRRADELGLEGTSFANPHGLDAPGHHSTARDLARLGEAAMEEPFLREIVGWSRTSVPGPGGAGTRTYESRNDLLDRDPEVDGVKTGMTDGAGHALIAHARRESLGVDLYLALIGSPSEEARARDAGRLLDWAFGRFARPTLVSEGAVYGRAEVFRRPGTSVEYAAASAVAAPVRVDLPLSETIVAPSQVRGPVARGERLGEVVLRQDGRVVGRSELRAVGGAAEAGLWDRLRAGVASVMP